MKNDIKNLPTMKEIEASLFKELQQIYSNILVELLEKIDLWLMDHRDFNRFKNHEKQTCTIGTLFGEIEVNRRIYIDRESGKRISLLDKYLELNGQEFLSPFLTELAVQWAVKGPSYRDARDRFKDILGYQVMSHETIRQKVLKMIGKDENVQSKSKKTVDALFLEIDGLRVHKQRSNRSQCEVKIGVAHEGWEKVHPGGDEYKLKNKLYWATFETGEDFWETFSRYLYNQYNITRNTYVIINGDGAPWIRKGIEYFPNAIYTYNRYHLKKWIKDSMRNRSKKERRKAYKAADANDPVALLVAVAEAEKAEEDEIKRKEIAELRHFILENQEAFRDYREILKQEGVNTEGMRPMGSAESNMNLFSKRLKKMGYSWSYEGLEAMTNSLIYLYEGSLSKAIQKFLTSDQQAIKRTKEYPSISSFLRQKVKESVGVIQGRMPALTNDDRAKPYIRALRSLAGF